LLLLIISRQKQWLKEGKIHIAGSHIEDPATGEFNLPFIKRDLAGDEFTVVTFAQWEEGLVTAAGNPKRIRNVEDLARKNVQFTNRQVGSGSRMLLDKLLKESGVPEGRVKGYNRIAQGHLAAAYTLASREADCCLSTRSAAQAFGVEVVDHYAEGRRALANPNKSLNLRGFQISARNARPR